MGKLSTHVLDTATGVPAADVEVTLLKKTDGVFTPLKTVRTNRDGRCDEPLLSGNAVEIGSYELVFNVEAYFGTLAVETPFLKDVVIRFYIDDSAGNYHVPLLISPYGYSTYKGS